MNNQNYIKRLASNNDSVKYEVILMWALVLIYGLLCLTGVLSFKLWPQVIDIWEKPEAEVEKMTFMNQPLLLRYYLVLPFFVLSKVIAIDYNYLFSAVVPILLYFSISNINKVVCDVARFIRVQEKSLAFAFSYLLLAGISLFMNGRILFAILGASILLYIVYFLGRLRLSSIVIGSFFGVFLSSVSTGTFIIFGLTFFIVSVFHVLSDTIKKNKDLLLFSVIFLVVVSPFFIQFFFKNLDFYGGGIEGFIKMFSHGLGFVFFLEFDFYIGLISAFVFALFIILVVNIFVRFEWLRLFLIMLSISLVGGLFGYSTMMMGIPPAIALISYSLMCFYNSILQLLIVDKSH